MAASWMKLNKMAVFRKQVSIVPLLVRHARQMSTASTFKYSDLQIDLCTKSRPKPDPDNLVFGREFADHMLEVDWTTSEGWGKPQICPVHNFSFHPAAKVFHYAIELYEGLKAYRGVDNNIRLFRPDQNMERMTRTANRATLPLFEGMKAYRGVDQKVRMFRPDKNSDRMLRTAARATLPTFDREELIKCLRKLISIDQEWVPYSTSSTLYIRPTMIGTEPSLGVAASTEAKLFVISGPVGPYYPTGFQPVTLLADPKYVRASPGGAGSFKMGSNYAPTIYTQMEATKQGCQQVLWLYGPDHLVTEVGTMNFFMYWVNEQGEEELVTPPLELDIILPGVTRLSLLELSRQWGEFKVSERAFTMKDIAKGLKEGRVKELFGAGTACVVSPIEAIIYEGKKLQIPTMDKGAPLTTRFHKELLDIQFARKPSEWMIDVDDVDSKAQTAARSG